MKRSLSDIQPVSSSHKVGTKRVLLAANESGCAITQIAVTDLKVEESGGQELLYTIYSLTFAQTNRASGLREA